MGDGGHAKRGSGSRGHRRSAAHGAQSSSEYSSSISQERHDGRSPAVSPRRAAPPPPYPRARRTPDSRTEDEDDDPLAGAAARPTHMPDPYETSDDSGATERDDGAHAPRFDEIGQRRGKKGLTNAELAMVGRRGGGVMEMMIGAGRDDETEDEEEEEVERPAFNRDGAHAADEVDDGDETEDEGEEYAAVLKRANVRAANERKRSLWAQCHPVVADAVKMLSVRGAEPSELGYAKLSGAGKIAVDYLVRKQSVVIGRSASLADCAIKSEGRLISRRHARLVWDTERKEWVITCLSEKNGILVNGIPVVPGSVSMPVKSRDLIEVGDVAFFFLAATAPVLRINDIPALEEKILSIRAQEERERAESEEERRRTEERYGGLRQGRNLHHSKRFKAKLNKRRAHELHRQRSSAGLAERSGSSKRRLSSMIGEDSGTSTRYKRGKHPGKKLKSRSGAAANGSNFRRGGRSEDEGEVDPDLTEDEDDDQVHAVSSKKEADRFLSYGLSKRRADRDALVSSERKRRRREDDASRYKEEWNKKERTDFGRALFAVGVDPVFDDDGSLAFYDWKRFRKIAELPKKSDDMLEDYYIRVMTDVNALLEEEEREKRTKGPRTKHKPGCDCIVCENTRKSRRKKQEERDSSFVEERGLGDSDGGEDGEVKSTAKSNDKLVGLVTAQKLRVRLSIHEAARKASSYAGDTVFSRLNQQSGEPVRDFPRWWRAGHHDRALMHGTGVHGVGQWSDIWNDPKERAFRKERERQGDEIEWPTNQAAMKRVREIASLINSELKREAKRAASDRGHFARHGRMKSKKDWSKYTASNKGKMFARRKKPVVRRGLESGDEYEVAHVEADETANGDGESTVESGSNNEVAETRDVSQIETEDEDDVEVEVEEEMEIEEVDEQETEDEEDSEKDRQVVVAKKPASAVVDMSTDDEDDDEDNIQYETASDTGSE